MMHDGQAESSAQLKSRIQDLKRHLVGDQICGIPTIELLSAITCLDCRWMKVGQQEGGI